MPEKKVRTYMPQLIPDEMPETMTKSFVTVGITRSKVIVSFVFFYLVYSYLLAPICLLLPK
jgi:hypothetical protein